MTSTDRVQERRRAAALARHYRDEEGLSIAEIARRLGRAPATIKAYLYDPTAQKARAVKARYVGVCRGFGAYMQPRATARETCLWPQVAPSWELSIWGVLQSWSGQIGSRDPAAHAPRLSIVLVRWVRDSCDGHGKSARRGTPSVR